MDTLAYVGKGYSTYSLVVSTIIGIVLIIIAILMFISASKGVEQSNDPKYKPMSVEMKVGIGIGLLVLGFILPYGSWVSRKMVRGNNKYAAAVGGIGIFNMFDF